MRPCLLKARSGFQPSLLLSVDHAEFVAALFVRDDLHVDFRHRNIEQDRLGPYSSLALLAVPVIIIEPLKLRALAILASSRIVLTLLWQIYSRRCFSPIFLLQ